MNKPTSKKSRKGITVSEAFSDFKPAFGRRFKKVKKTINRGSDFMKLEAALGPRGQGTVQSIRTVRMAGSTKGLAGIITDTNGENHVFLDPSWFIKFPLEKNPVGRKVDFRMVVHEETDSRTLEKANIWVLTDLVLI
jgi:hypothetical protein